MSKQFPGLPSVQIYYAHSNIAMTPGVCYMASRQNKATNETTKYI